MRHEQDDHTAPGQSSRRHYCSGRARRMSGFALALVLTAALLHASWNALLKAAEDRACVLAAVSSAHVLAGLVLISLAPLPAPASWPSIGASTLLHYGYYVLLFHTYRHGDLSQVYPISRGMAPALVALSAALFIGESLPPLGWAGLATVSSGIALLALQRGAAHAPGATILLAVLLGLFIAAYSVADGIGVRASGSPFGYMGWLFLLEAPVPLTVIFVRHRAGGRFAARTLTLGFLGGFLAVTAYGAVLYAKTIAPLGAVSAVRESSVIIAALFGVFFFGERPWQGRILAATIVVVGVMTLALSKG